MPQPHALLILSVLLLFGFGAARSMGEPVVDPDERSAVPVGYVLVWSDEFEGETLDTDKWGHRSAGPRRDGVNVPEAVTLDGEGHLAITTRRVGEAYHTGMIGTQGRFETTFGYFECRVRLQREVGHWSAFWLQSPTYGEPIGEPAAAGTEIDVFEYLRNSPAHVQHALHWDGYGEHHRSATHRLRAPVLGAGWHTFALHWTADRYVFYVDGVETWRTAHAVSQRDQYMILSLEVGSWAGDIAEAALPDALLVDYVRVYQQPDAHGDGDVGGTVDRP